MSIRELTRRYGTKVAVDGLSLDIPTGSFFGLVGPNGAGKSTTLRAVTGLLRPDRGTVVVDGIDVWADPRAAKARMGVLPEDPQLFERLSGAELLMYTGLLRRMPPAVVHERAAELLDVLGLSEAAAKMVVDYSQGMRKKMALACALLHAPRVLVLDEPFESVDPVSARTIQDVLGRYVASGATVVFSSHVMDTVERLCDHVAVMHEGRLVATGPTDELRGGQRLEEVFFDLIGRAAPSESTLTWLGISSD